MQSGCRISVCIHLALHSAGPILRENIDSTTGRKHAQTIKHLEHNCEG